MLFVVCFSKKTNTESDIFGVSRGSAATADDGTSARIQSYFVNRVANGCERRTALTNGTYYIDFKVYKANDVGTTDSLELWKKALVRLKFRTETDSPQWRKLQEFVKSVDMLFPDEPRFFKN